MKNFYNSAIMWCLRGVVALCVLTLLSIGHSFKAKAQVLVVDEATTNQEVLGLVNNILVGSCVNVSNITYRNLIITTPNDLRGAAGEFTNGASNIGFDNGIILTTGRGNNAEGPNNAENAQTNTNKGGDDDLAELIGVFPSQTYDAAVLEFDFYPLSDTIKFRYVFASEEYPEYVNSNFNDVFGFFISGPGINGPYSNNAENIALIPGTTTPVAINNVNNGQANPAPSTGPCENCQYYYENNTMPELAEVQYDAWTTPLTATAIVQKCNLYHIKLAVADVGDHIYDSGVFLEAKSFTAGDSIEIGIGFTTVSGGLYEGCNDGYFTFYRLDPGTLGDTLWTDIEITGTATAGVDYTTIPTSIAIPAGQDSVNIYINALLDGVVEGDETITFTLENFACGCTAPPSATLTIFDNNPPLTLSTSGTTTICRGESTDLTATVGGSVSPYTINWDNGGGSGTPVTVSPLNTTTYTVTVSDVCGGQTLTSSETVTVLNAEFVSSGGDSACLEGNSFSFVNTGASNPGYIHSWDFGDGSGTSTDENPTYSYSSPGNYTVIHTLNTGFCTTTETLDIEVFEHPTAVITNIEDVTCPGGGNGSITVTPSGGVTPYSYYWTPGGQTGSTAINLGVGFHTVVVTDFNYCNDTITGEIVQADDIPPTAVCQDLTIQLDPSGNASITAAQIDNGSSDNCGVASLSLSQSAFTCAHVGANTVTLTVTDTDGNTATCDATVTVQDTTPPTAICQNVTVNLDGSGNASITASQVDNGSNDECGIASLSVSPNTFTCADVGGNTVTLTVTDANGNTSTCTATVTVQDVIPPTAICVGLTVYLDASGNASITANDVDGGSTDNCGIASLNVSPSTFDCNNLGNNTATLTVTDLSGNVSTCTAGVFVDDTITPVAVCQDITVNVDGTGSVTITGADIDGGSTDNCSGLLLVASPNSFDCDDLGAQTVTLTATDADGNSSTCTATVTIQDVTPPTAVCQDLTVYLDAAGNVTVPAIDVNNGSSDNCGLASGTLTPNTFTCNEVGANTATLTVFDDAGLSSSCNATITVVDTVPPVAVCQDITVYLDASGDATITAAQIDNGSTDNCAIALYAVTPNTFDCGDVGANTVTLTVTDIYGNLSSCTATVIVEDTISPVAVCQDITVQLDASGNATITTGQVDNGSSDNCGIASLVLSDTDFGCADEGANVVTLTVTDNNGNISTCTATVTVENNVPPTITCQDITVYLDGNGNVSIAASDVNAGSSAACGLSSLVVSPNSFDCSDVGANTVTLTATDNSGNVSNCNATVTVLDTTSPIAICQNITVQLDATGNVSITSANIDNGSTDNCGIASLSLDETDFDCSGVGANTVTLTVTDVNGNVSACQATVTVQDTTSPTAICQNLTVQLDATGNGSITASQIDNGSFDNCGIASLSLNQTDFDCSDVGANTVTLTVTDVNGNTSTCTATVTVEDSINPTALCQNLTVYLDGSGAVSITGAEVDNGSFDNCGIASLVVSPNSFTCANVGNNAVTLTVTDVNGNTSTCGANVTVLDTIAPTAVCQNITVGIASNGFATITANDIDGGSTDSCGIASLSASQTSFDCNQAGPNNVTLTVTDVNGNVSTCVAVVTVNDATPPTAVCTDITVELGPNGTATIAAGDVDDGSSDICGIASITVSPNSFTCAEIGANTVTLTVTDLAGNTSTCTATATVVDNVNPTALCQNLTIQLDATGNASITANDVDNGSSDACGIASIIANPTDFTCADVGSNSVTLTVTDNEGNQSTCVANVTVQDTISPTAICQDITVQLNAAGTASITAALVDNGSFDNCAIATRVVSPSTFNCSNVGANTVTLTVTDVNGNVSTCTATVTVQDTVSPNALCRNITVPLDASGNVSITAAQVNNGSTDNCGIASISVSPNSFTCADVGANTVTLTVTDVNGNVSTCSATVNVVDNIDPIALCQNITVQLDGSGSASITATQIDNGSTDNCGIASLSASPTSFNCSNVGSNTVTLTVTDVNGNVSTCTATVTVQDTVSPNAVCQNLTLSLDASGQASITAGQVDNGSTDNCGIASMSVSPNTFTCADTGSNVVTLTVTDVNGNVSTCTSTVTINDNTPPTALCQNLTVYLDASGQASITANDVDNGSFDNCAIASMNVAPNSFTCSGVGPNPVTLTVTDVNGNVSTCSAVVTVLDTISPIASCQDITIQLNPSGTVSINATQVDNGSNDACGVASLDVNPSTFNCSNIGPNTVTLTVTDENGNVSTCSATVNIEDNTAPTAICQDITVYLDANGDASIVADDIDNGSNDACGVDTMTVSPNTFSCADVGANTVTLTVTDINGNSSNCTATVTVVDTVSPNVLTQDITVYLDATGNVSITSSQIDAGSNDSCGVISVVVNPGDFDCNDVGDNTVTLTVTDNNGNVSSSTATVTVVDTISPTAVCQNLTVELDAGGQVVVTAAEVDNSSTDNCDIASIKLDGDVDSLTFDCSNLGSNTVTLTVTDVNGNTSTCTATITVEDNLSTPPSAVCQDITVYLDASGNVSITATDVDGGSSDNCSDIDLSVSPSSFTCVEVGANTVTLTVTDGSGNVSTCNATVTVMDTISPVAVCQNLTVQLDANGDAVITAAEVDDGSNDACGIASIELDGNADTLSFDCSNVGTNTVTLTVTDVNGNISTCSATITVEDTVSPTAICQDLTIQLDANGDVVVTAAEVDNGSFDNCGIANISLDGNADTLSFDCSNVGANTVTLTVTDVNGNISTCSATITVEDTVSPTAVCQDLTIQLDNNGDVIITATDVDNGSFDNCGIADISLDGSQDTLSFDCSNVGSNSVTLTVTDINGNISTCSATITVEDTVSPTAICQDLTIQLDANGDVSVTALEVDNGSFDNCGIASIELDGNADTLSFDCSEVGANTVTLTVTDVNGNISTCSATITVEDTVSPTAICQDLTIELDSNGQVVVDAIEVDNGSFDNCGIASIKLDGDTDSLTFDCSNLGTNTVTLAVTDVNGNTTTCTATITVEDNNSTPPSAVCQDITIYLDATGNASITATDVDGGSSDNCNDIDLSVSPSSFTCAEVGTNTVTLTVTDGSGNVSTCTATVTVLDTIAPTAVCQNLTIQLDANGEAIVTATSVDNGSSDICGIADITLDGNADTLNFDCNSVGSNTVTLTVTDVNGNSSSCTATITVEDTVSPTAVCQDLTIQLDNNGDVIITSAEVDNGSFDNCGIADISLDGSADTLNFDCNSVGSNTVTLTVTDVNGNSSSCTATITVEDTVSPTAVCQDLTIQLDVNGEVIITSAEVDNGSFDNCGIADISLDGSADTLSFDCNSVGSNTVTLTVTDVNGNISTCQATITVQDTVSPTAVCQDLTIQLDNNGDVIITSAEVDNGSFDNCGIADISLDGSADTLNFDCNSVGSNTVTLTVTDVNGNISTCQATITVQDTVSPTAICQDLTVQLDSNGQVVVDALEVDNGSFDNCGIADIKLDGDTDSLTFDCSNIGSNTVTVTVTDVNGNVSTCSATITVEDNNSTPPSAVCQDITIYLDAAGQAGITATDVDGGSGDNCGVASLSVSPDTFDCSNVGANTVTLTVTDNSGNVSTCNATVTVLDTIAPTAICQDITVQLDGDGNLVIDPNQIDNGSFDNCGIASLELDGNADTLSFDCFTVGSNTVTLIVTDVNGNVTTCQSTVTVVDTTAPQAVCQDITVYLGPNGTINISSNDVDGGSTDACGIVDTWVNPNAFSCTEVGVQTAVLYVEDAHGNLDSCFSTVTVLDTVAPELSCSDITVSLDSAGNASITPNDIIISADDACFIDSMAVTPDNFDCSNVGSNTVTVTVFDVNGNSSSCQSTVTVQDTISPVVACQNITVQLDADGEVFVYPQDIDNGSLDNCDILSMTLDGSDSISFNCLNVGVNSLTLFVTDVNGNVSTCESTVMVEDTVSPTAVCQDITVQLDANGELVLLPGQIDNGSFDNCSIASLELDGNTDSLIFDCSQVGANTVTLIVTDVNGNVSTCQSTVTVEDTIAPTATCQDITIQLDANGEVVLLPSQVDNGSFDNCGIASLELDGNADTLNFDCSQVGANTVTLIVTDVNGNISSCQATVTVEDTVAPTAICQDLTIQLDANGEVVINAAEVDNGSFDNCGVASIELDGNVDSLSFDCSQVGVNTANLIVTDVNGNISTCQSTITVEDTVSPTAICQDITVQLDANGDVVVLPNQVDNGSFDNCGIASLELDGNSSQLNFDCSQVGANTVTLIVTDNNGNVSTCQATVTVVDTVSPTVICQDITVQLDPNGDLILTPDMVDNGSFDNCGIANLELDGNADSLTFDCFSVGSNTVTLIVTDVNGNVSTCQSTVTVVDTVSPTVVCQDITVQLNSVGTASITAAMVDNGSADSCGIASMTVSPNSFNCSNVGANTVTLTVTDIHGNVSTCQSVVTIQDTVPPVPICQNLNIALDSTGNASIDASQIDFASTDNCAIDTITVSPNTFDCSNLGPNTVTLTVTDINGNSATCNATVTVRDDIAPQFVSCPTNIVVGPDSSNCNPSVSWVVPTATDNCNDLTVTSNFDSGDNFSVGTTTITYIVTDEGGNTDVCNFTVTVLADTLALTMNSLTGPCGYNVSCNGDTNATITTTVSGGCLPYSYMWSNGETTSSISDIGAGTYLVTVTDANGNQIAGSITLTEPAPISVDDLSSPTYPGGWNVTCNGESDGSIDLLADGGANCQAYSYSWSGPNGYSSNDQNPDNIEAGTYTVVITDINGCSLGDSITITEPEVLTASINDVVNVSCNGLSDASATVSVSGGTPTYQYFWSDITGQTGSTATGLSAGTYTVTVTDANGCTTTTSITITEPGVLEATAFVASDYNGQDITCTGASDGIASVSVSAGTSPYTYQWSTSSNNDSIFNLAAGSYTVTVTDANGCTDIDTVQVTDPPILTASANVIQVGCNGGSDGAISVTPSGGTAPYIYVWSTTPPQTTIAITNLGAGTYTVTVTDANSCSVPMSVNVNEPQLLQISLNDSADVSCFGASNGYLDINVTGGTQPFGYQWTGGYSTEDISGLSGGTYTVTVTDANLCSATATYTLDEPTNALSLTIDTVVNISCSGLTDGSATVSAQGGTAPYTYTWNDPANQTGPTATNLAVGTYIVTATDANGCTATVSVVVIVPNPVVISFIGQQDVSCNGGANGFATAGVAGGTAPYDYNWSSSHQTQTANGLSAGTYTLTVTDANGCFETDTITIHQPQPLSISVLSNSGIPCNGDTTGSVSVEAQGGTAPYDYYWSTGDSGAVVNGLPVGNYSVTVRDANNCTSILTVSITQPAPLHASVTGVVNPTCHGDENGAAIAVASGGSPGYTYLWAPGGFSQSTIDSLGPGTNVLTITDAHGCTATDTFVLVEPPQLIVEATGDSAICAGGSAEIIANAIGGSGGITYWWNQGIGYSQGATVSPGEATTYKVTATDDFGCEAEDSITVSISTGSDAEFSLNNYFSCVYPVTINVNNTSSNATAYEWDFGNSATSTEVNPTPTFDTVGTFTITLITTNGPGCADTASRVFEVGEQPLAQFTITDTAGCAPVAVNFINQTIDGISYTWNFGDGGTSSVANPVHTYEEPGNYDVTLIASGGGACNDTVTISSGVVIYPNPVADFIYDFENPFEPDGNVVFTNWSSGASSYHWAFGDGDTSVVVDPEHFYDSHGEFSVVLTAYNQFGCSDTALADISIDFLKGLQVPNAFMLGGGEGTGSFLPVGRAVDEYYVQVFDKWGNLLWESTAVENGTPAEAWDGTYKGAPVPMGAYIWKIEATFDDGSIWEGMEMSNGKVSKTGSVMVIR